MAVNGILFYAVKTSAGADQLTDVLFVAYVGKDGLSQDQARVMFPNGDKATISLKNAYVIDQDGNNNGDIQDGAFYEYSKSGSTYELIELSTEDDFYGDFTYRGDAATLAATGTMTYNGTTKNIADSADVIVWTQNGDAVEFKHITGKQLKSLIDTTKSGGADIEIGDSNGELSATLLGGFTSDVDGLNRASVLAVKYNSADGKLSADFDNISANANYGFITKDAVKLSNGNIKFTVWTGTENVEVTAEKSSEVNFTAGTIVGYTAINTVEGAELPVMTDAVAITSDVDAGSITAVNGAVTKIETNISGAAEDLDDYSVVLYVNSKEGTGLTDGTAAVANSQKVGTTTYYATNILVYGTEVAVIDVNEIAGSTYGAYTLPATISGLTDVQWLNTRTNDTDEGAAYEGAIMQLSFYAANSGTLTLTNVADVETGAIGTVTLYVKGGDYNRFDSLIVTDDVTATFTASGSTTTPDPDGASVTIKSSAPTLTYGGTTGFDVNVVYKNAIGETPKMEVYTKADATTRKTNLVDSTNVTETTAFGFVTSNNETAAQGKLTQGATLAAGDYVLVVKVGKAEATQEFTVAKAKVTKATIASFTEATSSDKLSTYNPGSLTGTLTPSGAANTVTPVVDKDNCVIANGDKDTIAAADKIVVTITVKLTDANNYEFASNIATGDITLSSVSNTAVSKVAIVNSELVITATTTVA